MERKLAAILSADVQGYSRLMGDDEEATIQTLKTYREVITNLIEQHHGRVVDAPGDNLLAEFASAVDAVQAAVAIQQELKTRNAELEAHRQMAFRIGLNVGDVIADEGRLYGDGVNIAARLEGLADPSGICLSGTVYDQIANKLDLPCTYQGEQTVKNITKPVRAYTVQLDSDGTTPPVRPTQSALRPVTGKRPLHRWPMATVAVIAVLLVGAGLLVYRTFSPQLSPPLETETAEEAPVLPLPDKPSIAVLPFTNMSGDPEQDYFSDGITDDLITDLSKISGLFVIARHSVFTYKGKAVEVGEVSRKLGVRYVLEGSTRQARDRVRINVQLIDATTGGYLWAERYDRELHGLFAVQDEITQAISRSLQVEIQAAERERVRRVPTAKLTAYDAWLRGMEYAWRLTQDDNAHARQLFERAIELDPQYADAYAWLGWTYYWEWGWWNLDPPLLERAGELAQHALTLDDSLPDAHGLLGTVYLWQKRLEQAIAAGERAIALDPNWADAYVWLAEILNYAGRAEEAVGLVSQAMRLNPHYAAYYPLVLGRAYSISGQYDEAIAALQEALRLNPNDPDSYSWLALSYLAQWVVQGSQEPQTLEHAAAAAQQSVALSDAIFWTHGVLSAVYLWQKQHEEALAEAKRAMSLNPTDTDTDSLSYLGSALNSVGRPEDTLEMIEQVTCPTVLFVPAFCFRVLGDAYYLTRRYEEAIAAYKQALRHKFSVLEGLLVHLGLAVTYSELDQEKEANAEIAEVLNINPQYSLEGIQLLWPYKDPAVTERIASALRQAGLE